MRWLSPTLLLIIGFSTYAQDFDSSKDKPPRFKTTSAYLSGNLLEGASLNIELQFFEKAKPSVLTFNKLI